MTDREQKRVLVLAVKAGEMMMKAGAEIYRVEDTITRICHACGITYVDVFATTTGFFVTLDDGGRESDVFTSVRRIRGAGTNLTMISEINRFSREFTTTDMTVEEGIRALEKIEAEPAYPLPVRLLGACLVSSFFCLIFGGDVWDFVTALPAGLICYGLSILLGKIDTNIFIHGLCCCFTASALALISGALGLSHNVNSIIIGVLMIFVPGVSFTNSMRDFLSGDMVSGLARLAEALMIAVSLAVGAGLMLSLWSVLGGGL